MDLIEFSRNMSAEQIGEIFKNFFEQHMVAYHMLHGINFVSLNSVTQNKCSIMYSVKLLDSENKELIVERLKNIPLVIYGKQYIPDVFLNGDLLCITINK